jgi:hypothetical protein
MARNSTILDFSRTLSDGNRIDDLTSPHAASVTVFASPHRSPRSQMPHEFFFKHASSLNEEASVDGFVGDLHLLVVWISPLQPPRNLLR